MVGTYIYIYIHLFLSSFASSVTWSAVGQESLRGNGCFWHTQYDTFLIEEDPAGPFRRNQSGITSLVGYAGGRDLGS